MKKLTMTLYITSYQTEDSYVLVFHVHKMPKDLYDLWLTLSSFTHAEADKRYGARYYFRKGTTEDAMSKEKFLSLLEASHVYIRSYAKILYDFRLD